MGERDEGERIACNDYGLNRVCIRASRDDSMEFYPVINDSRKRKQPHLAELRDAFWSAPNDALLDRRTVAAGLNVSVSLLEKLVTNGRGPAYLDYGELGRLRRYRKADVIDWFTRKVRRKWSSSETGAVVAVQ